MMKKKWSEDLAKTSIEGALVDELLEQSTDRISEIIEMQLRAPVKSVENLNTIRSLVESIRDSSNKSAVTDIFDEIEEIEDDFEWSSSAKGSQTLAINDWVQTFYNEFRSNRDFEDVYIGGHTSKDVVFVCGKVKGSAVLQQLEKYVESKSPPFKLMYDVKLS